MMVVGEYLLAEEGKKQKTGTGFKLDTRRVQLRLSEKEQQLRADCAFAIEHGPFTQDTKKQILSQFDRAIYRYGLLWMSELLPKAKVRLLLAALNFQKPRPKGGRPHG